MKQLLAALIVLAFVTPAFAEDPEGMGAIMDEFRDRTPASLTFGEMEEIAAALSVPAQEAAYVRHSAMASAIVPGMGQFKNGDPLAGTLFLLADLSVSVGTAVGLYFLLPPELRFDQLNYFTATSAEIQTAYETAADNASLATSWPFMAVATGGMILNHVVSHLSARHAANLASRNIQSGDVTFTPNAGFMMGRHGPGMSFGLRY